RRRRPTALPHRVGRPDAPQPRPARRGADTDRPPQAPRVAGPGPRLPTGRRHRPLGAAARRHLAPLRTAGRLRAARPGAALPLGRRAPGPPDPLTDRGRPRVADPSTVRARATHVG